MIESRIKSTSTNGDGEITPVRLLELGSGISDVSSMVWHLIMKGIDSKKLHTKAGPNCQPQSLFEIVDIEYEQVGDDGWYSIQLAYLLAFLSSPILCLSIPGHYHQPIILSICLSLMLSCRDRPRVPRRPS